VRVGVGVRVAVRSRPSRTGSGRCRQRVRAKNQRTRVEERFAVDGDVGRIQERAARVALREAGLAVVEVEHDVAARGEAA
jgi:hypothetical protein